MTVLLIYEIVPEDTKFYVFEDPSPALCNTMLRCNGLYNNIDLEDEDAQLALDELNMVLGNYEDKQVPVKHLPFKGPFDKVFHTGIIL